MRTLHLASAVILSLSAVAFIPATGTAQVSGAGQLRPEWLLVQNHSRDDFRRHEPVPDPYHGSNAPLPQHQAPGYPPQHDRPAGVHVSPGAYGMPAPGHPPAVIVVPAPGSGAHHPQY
ncbi:hypothetical protein QWZ14_00540 [Paeniroseomonas aquatica]|jgi:hypothetical protein|uniref:Secreted protein n=1 Tax=Paeniroseomonas aquatica TaxID=373043 RepID=A0ABT7ZZH3_9PROT|nr:hypothetical protein [Paeniroseomonas aquatica]MDN3562870.1 hypothetical protein [Paeniroseomonas aquatica]